MRPITDTDIFGVGKPDTDTHTKLLRNWKYFYILNPTYLFLNFSLQSAKINFDVGDTETDTNILWCRYFDTDTDTLTDTGVGVSGISVVRELTSSPQPQALQTASPTSTF